MNAQSRLSGKIWVELFIAIVLFAPRSSGFAQGTFHYGFENDQVGSVPINFRRVTHFYSDPVVADSTSWPATAFEGNRFLAAMFGFEFAAPADAPLLTVSLMAYVQPPSIREANRVILRLGDSTVNVTEFNRWLLLETTLRNPSWETFIAGDYQVLGEFWPASFAIDAITITTVPEPRAIALLSCGLVLLLPRKRRPVL